MNECCYLGSFHHTALLRNQYAVILKRHQEPFTCMIFMYMIINHQLQYTSLYTTITQIIQVLNVLYFFFITFFSYFFFSNLICMLKKSQSWVCLELQNLSILRPLSHLPAPKLLRRAVAAVTARVTLFDL